MDYYLRRYKAPCITAGTTITLLPENIYYFRDAKDRLERKPDTDRYSVQEWIWRGTRNEIWRKSLKLYFAKFDIVF